MFGTPPRVLNKRGMTTVTMAQTHDSTINHPNTILDESEITSNCCSIEKCTVSNFVPLPSYHLLGDEEKKVVLEKAADILRYDKIIAIPTDTIYGIAARAQSIEAVNKLYDIKGRSFDKPVSICVRDLSQLKE
eukprot:Pgem_evm1s12143